MGFMRIIPLVSNECVCSYQDNAALKSSAAPSGTRHPLYRYQLEAQGRHNRIQETSNLFLGWNPTDAEGLHHSGMAAADRLPQDHHWSFHLETKIRGSRSAKLQEVGQHCYLD